MTPQKYTTPLPWNVQNKECCCWPHPTRVKAIKGTFYTGIPWRPPWSAGRMALRRQPSSLATCCQRRGVVKVLHRALPVGKPKAVIVFLVLG